MFEQPEVETSLPWVSGWRLPVTMSVFTPPKNITGPADPLVAVVPHDPDVAAQATVVEDAYANGCPEIRFRFTRMLSAGPPPDDPVTTNT